jgi:hypothetical protein
MSARRGSAAFTIVLGGMTALVVGGMVITFVFHPVATALLNSPFFGMMTTSDGVRVTTYVEGAWIFTPGIILIAILSHIWVHTRQ